MPRPPSSPGQRRLRVGRRSEPGQVYFLTTVTEGRARLFEPWHAACCMSRHLSNPELWPGARLLCWVLMPDHWHGLLSLENGGSLARAMNIAKGRSAREFNADMGRRGSVWAPGFHDRALRRDDNLRRAAGYLIANPLRAGLSDSVANYPFWDAIWLSDPNPLQEGLQAR